MERYFNITGKRALITGAGGLLGIKHAEALLDYGALEVIMTDHHLDRVQQKVTYLKKKYGKKSAIAMYMDVTHKKSIQDVANSFDHIDILINNATKDPKVKKGDSINTDARFENMTEQYWFEGINAAINGTFLCSQIIINKMLKQKGGGVILNIASDLSVIAPDQRIYLKKGLKEYEQNVKPITYSVAKWAIVGMTKYLAVYFAKKNIRVNCLSPTGVYNDHPKDFVDKLTNIIPMGRMANIDEYKGAIIFLCSDASSYMTGENMVIDGGKTII